MRITTSMINDRVIFNMQRSIARFSELQTNMSSGRRINKPSDDPIGTLRDLDYRTELGKIEQFRKNISQGQNWMNTYDSSLSDLKDFVSTAKELAVAMANGNFDKNARSASAGEIQSLMDQMVQLSNRQLEGRQIFGGFKTQIKSFRAGGNGIEYLGDKGEIQFEVESSQLMTINLDGQSVFLDQMMTLGENSDLNIAVTGNTLLSDLNNGNGIVPGQITITDLNDDTLPVSTIDLSGATTINEVINTINAQLTADGLTNITARISDQNNSFYFDTTENGIISNSTSLSKLNSGLGVDLSNGKIRISDGASINALVDLTGSQTVGDIITKFNADLNAQLALGGHSPVNIAINSTRTGFEITDTNVPPLGLTIEDIDSSTKLSENLGILGDISASMTGSDLNPVTHFEIAESGSSTAADLGILGDFSRSKFGEDLNPNLIATNLLSEINSGLGMSLGEITIHQGLVSHTIDLGDPALVTIQDVLDLFNNSGLAITASINNNGDGIQIENNDVNLSFAIDETSGGSTAKDVGLFGSSDIYGTMTLLRNALEADDQKGTGLLLDGLDQSIEKLLNNRSKVGARAVRLDTTDHRMIDLHLGFTKLLSEVEDADITELVSNLATFENNYRASLIAAGKVIQPSLLDFLRL